MISHVNFFTPLAREGENWMTKFRYLIWTLMAASGLILSASQSQAQLLRQPDVGDQPGLIADDSVELDP